MAAATDLPSAIAEIQATLYQNAIGAITAVKMRQLLIDIVNVLDVIALAAGQQAGTAAGSAAGQAAGNISGAAAGALAGANSGAAAGAQAGAIAAVPATDAEVALLNPGLIAQAQNFGALSGQNAAIALLMQGIANVVDAELLSYPVADPGLAGQFWWDSGVLVQNPGGAAPAYPTTGFQPRLRAAIDARLLSYPQADPGTPGALWWDGGILTRNPGVWVFPAGTGVAIASNLLTGPAIDAQVMSYPAIMPILPGRLWWDGASGAGSVLAMS